MSQKTIGIHKIFSYPFVYSLTQKIMSGESKRSSLVSKIMKNSNVLDIGCGTAKILDDLPKVNYYGYDISKKYINYAKKKYKKKTNNFFCKKFSISEIKKLPKFDFVLLFGVMHHLSDVQLEKILSLIKKVLKKKGKLLTCDPIYEKKQNFIARYLIEKDVGQEVRFKNGYLKILNKKFKKINYKIDHQKLIPYTWFSTSCQSI